MFSWRYLARRKIHSSIFIAFMAVGLIIGICLSPILIFEFYDFSWLVLAVILTVACFAWRRMWLITGIVIAGLLIGLWRGDNQILKTQGYERYYNQKVILSGTIFEDVSEGKRSDTQIQLKNIQINGQKLPEKVWLSLHTKTALKRSDNLEVEGVLKPGFGSFAANMSYAKIVSLKKGADEARDIRDNFSRNVKKAISEPEASLGLGFVVGGHSSLPSELDDQLRVVGLTHIVVASGYNLTILVRFSEKIVGSCFQIFNCYFKFFDDRRVYLDYWL